MIRDLENTIVEDTRNTLRLLEAADAFVLMACVRYLEYGEFRGEGFYELMVHKFGAVVKMGTNGLQKVGAVDARITGIVVCTVDNCPDAPGDGANHVGEMLQDLYLRRPDYSDAEVISIDIAELLLALEYDNISDDLCSKLSDSGAGVESSHDVDFDGNDVAAIDDRLVMRLRCKQYVFGGIAKRILDELWHLLHKRKSSHKKRVAGEELRRFGNHDASRGELISLTWRTIRLKQDDALDGIRFVDGITIADRAKVMEAFTFILSHQLNRFYWDILGLNQADFDDRNNDDDTLLNKMGGFCSKLMEKFLTGSSADFLSYVVRDLSNVLVEAECLVLFLGLNDELKPLVKAINKVRERQLKVAVVPANDTAEGAARRRMELEEAQAAYATACRVHEGAVNGCKSNCYAILDLCRENFRAKHRANPSHDSAHWELGNVFRSTAYNSLKQTVDANLERAIKVAVAKVFPNAPNRHEIVDEFLCGTRHHALVDACLIGWGFYGTAPNILTILQKMKAIQLFNQQAERNQWKTFRPFPMSSVERLPYVYHSKERTDLFMTAAERLAVVSKLRLTNHQRDVQATHFPRWELYCLIRWSPAAVHVLWEAPRPRIALTKGNANKKDNSLNGHVYCDPGQKYIACNLHENGCISMLSREHCKHITLQNRTTRCPPLTEKGEFQHVPTSQDKFLVKCQIMSARALAFGLTAEQIKANDGLRRFDKRFAQEHSQLILFRDEVLKASVDADARNDLSWYPAFDPHVQRPKRLPHQKAVQITMAAVNDIFTSHSYNRNNNNLNDNANNNNYVRRHLMENTKTFSTAVDVRAVLENVMTGFGMLDVVSDQLDFARYLGKSFLSLASLPSANVVVDDSQLVVVCKLLR